MITENAILDLLELETQNPGTGVWTPWLASAREVSIVRGGKRKGPTSTVDVGTLTATLVDAGDPLAGGTLKPGLPVRIGAGSAPIFTGRIVDVFVKYQLNKKTGKTTALVTLFAADAVASHANTTRYGAVTAGGAGFETWAQRIIRLASSASTPTTVPADDAPIVRYGL